MTESKFVEYPKWLHPPQVPVAVIVQSAEEEEQVLGLAKEKAAPEKVEVDLTSTAPAKSKKK